MIVRREHEDDIDAVRAIHEAAFEGPDEAKLVDLLRERGKALLSLVAESARGVAVGHIVFSAVSDGGLGLAPVGVLPKYQKQGVGKALIEAGLAQCSGFVVVLGDPAYCRRFGFERASDRGLRNEYGADDAFMVLELTPGSIPAAGTVIRYAPEFGELSV